MILRILMIFLMCVLTRTIRTVQKLNETSGNRKITAFLIGLDTIIFLLIFKNVLSDDLSVGIVISMASGYIIGYYIGSAIESKMALGKILVTIKIGKDQSKALWKILTENGYVFTRSKRIYTHKNKSRKLYQGVIFRKELPELKSLIKKLNYFAYTEPIKSTFGKEIVSSKDYIQFLGTEKPDLT